MSDDATIWDRDVTAPDALQISAAMQNPSAIAAWWERVKTYTEAMQALDRAVLLKHDEETWYLSSADATDPAPKPAPHGQQVVRRRKS